MKLLHITIIIIIILIIIYNKKYKESFTPLPLNELIINNTDSKYIINLDKRIDRWNITSKLLFNKGYTNLKKYKAVEGNRIPKDSLYNIVSNEAIDPIIKGYRTEHHELSIGAVGCYLSHINVWELGNEINNYNYVIIFEDDTYPILNSDELQVILNDLPQDWDLCILGGTYNRNNIINNNFCKINRFFGLYAYIINKKCINYLLKNAFPVKQQIDSWLSDLSIQNKINIYGMISEDWLTNNDINNTNIQTPMIEEPLKTKLIL